MRQKEFFQCCIEGNIKAVKRLIKGVDVNYEYSGTYVLIDAVANDCKDVVKLLIENGANIECHELFGFNATPLMRASINNLTDMVKLLLHYGANINTQDPFGDTALMWAYHYNDIATLLKETNIDLNDNEGKTALMKAC